MSKNMHLRLKTINFRLYNQTTFMSLHKQRRPDPHVPQKDPLDTSFNDPIAAFKSKTNFELARAYFLYSILSFDYFVVNNTKAMKFCQRIFGDRLFALLMKATFYGHFVGGETLEKTQPTLERLRFFGVRAILDYSVEVELTGEEAEKLEIEASLPEKGDVMENESIKKFHLEKQFADRRYRVQGARTYFYQNEASCERNMEVFIECLQAVAMYEKEALKKRPQPNLEDWSAFGRGIIAIKMTALGRPQLLLQLSEVIMRTRKYMTDLVGGDGPILQYRIKRQDLEKKFQGAKFKDMDNVKKFLDQMNSDSEGIIVHLFPWQQIIEEQEDLHNTFMVPNPKTGTMVKFLTQLSPNEEEMFKNTIRRLHMIARAAREFDVRVMIDAEQSYFQPAISRLTLEFMRKYNQEKPIIFTTYQNYLRGTHREIAVDLDQAKRHNFCFGAKLVRGAYLYQERERSAMMGYEDPTCPNHDATTEMYHKTFMECLMRIKEFKEKGEDKRRIGIMVASHNEESVRFALEKMKEINILPEDKVICFGQLLGMCDNITFPLGQVGYAAYKYVPYGPVNEVLPYLSRRVEENRGVLDKVKKEKRLLRKELFRRLASGKVWYVPRGNYVPV